MDIDRYLKMVDSQLKEAETNMQLSEKKYKEDKAKYDAILSFKENYIKWVGGHNEKHDRSRL